MSIGNNPAFPCEAQGDRTVPEEHDYLQTGIHTGKFPGLTIRDWFAGRALAAAWDARDKGYFEGDDHDMARCAYQIADAMLAARKQEQQ